MTIATGSLVYIHTFVLQRETLCVILSDGRPEFIGISTGHYYYQVYCFETRNLFLAFDYEMTLLGKDGLDPYYTQG